MGSSKSKPVLLPRGVHNAGCLRDMYKKHGPECVDQHLLDKWNRWTDGKFPLDGTLSRDRLLECRDKMEERGRPFKPELFAKWEKEAEGREQKRGQTRAQRERDACAVNLEETVDQAAAVYLQKGTPAVIKRKPPNYDDTWAPVYPPLPQLQPPPVQPQPQAHPPLQPQHAQLQPQIVAAAAAAAPTQGTSPFSPTQRTPPLSQLLARPLRQQKGAGVVRLTYGSDGNQISQRTLSVQEEEEEEEELASYYQGNVGSPQCVFQAPVLQLPGPQGNLINVARPWLPDELKTVAAALPKPEEGIEVFIEAVRRMDTIYKPTTSEMAVVLAKKCAPHWLQLREHLPIDLDRIAPAVAAQVGPPAVAALPDGETRYQQALDNMFTALRASYTATEDWTKMAISQGTKETAREFLGRVSQAVSRHGGVTTNANQKEALIRQYFILGGKKEVMEYVKSHLVTWSIAAPNELLQYAENFERIKEKAEQRKQDDFQEAALSFYQTSVRKAETPKHMRQRGKRSFRGNGGGKGGNSTPPPPNDVKPIECWKCGKLGHMARNCRTIQGPQRAPQPTWSQHAVNE